LTADRLPDLLVIGNLVIDDIAGPDGDIRAGVAGGAVVYAALGAALWGARVGLVAIAGADYPRDVFERLRERGVALDGLSYREGRGLRVRLAHAGDVSTIDPLPGRLPYAAWTPAEATIPHTWRTVRAVFLTPMPLERQQALLEVAVSHGAEVSLAPHSAMTSGTRDRWVALLRRAVRFFVNGARWPSWPWPGGTLKTIVITEGSRGGRLLGPEGIGRVWQPLTHGVVDPTGAGDAFAGGFLAAVLKGESEEAAIARGLVSASFALEGWGASALLAATPEDAEARRQQWFNGSLEPSALSPKP